jgi:multisubunit Na+/H+ antiporter MnhB subunit
MEMPSFFVFLDPYLIWSYRSPDNAYVGFCLGTLVLVLICLVLGEITISLAARLLEKHLENLTVEAVRYQDLSIAAAQAGDKASFQAVNKLANEAFGKSFFPQVALSMARLWPVPFALAWMQYRFLEIEFPLPLVGLSLGYIGIFIIIYVAAYMLFKRLRAKLPLTWWMQKSAYLSPPGGGNKKPGRSSTPAGNP